MITIFIHNAWLNEKKYIFDFVFKEIFGTEYKLVVDNVQSYRIIQGNSRLVIADAFFSGLEKDTPYYRNVNLVPDKISFANYPDYNISSIPVLFGKEELRSDDGFLFLSNDIFAAIFFMLTRWEEIAVGKFDIHHRFDENESLAVKNKFFLRPIVNEYIVFLKDLLQKSGISLNPMSKKYRIFFTHDVDEIARYDKPIKIVKALTGDLIKRKSINTFLRTIKDVYKIKFGKQKDVYDTFDFIMDLSEKRQIKSRFYFIPGLPGEEDVRFDINRKNSRKIIDNVKKRRHIVGIHPSYSSFDNKKQLLKELRRLKNYCNNLFEGRQHYLRFSVPETWQSWEDAGLKVDSSMGYYSHVGFRCGICMEYPVFNVVTRKQLNLRERPLIVMDTALRRFAGNKENAFVVATDMAKITKMYNGDFVLLWHNSNLSVNEWKGWDEVYKNITQTI